MLVLEKREKHAGWAKPEDDNYNSASKYLKFYFGGLSMHRENCRLIFVVVVVVLSRLLTCLFPDWMVSFVNTGTGT